MGLTLVSRNNLLASSQEQRHRLALTTACPPFETTMAQAGLAPLHATGITVLQLNVGKLCNQTCRHCHVDAGPERREQMTRETAELCMRAGAERYSNRRYHRRGPRAECELSVARGTGPGLRPSCHGPL